MELLVAAAIGIMTTGGVYLMPRLRRLYGRSGISKLEMNILRGILTETQKAARGEPHKRRSD